MTEYTCNLCRKLIRKYDIRMSFDIEIDGRKTDKIDMHAHCFYDFMEAAKEKLLEKEEKI